MDNYKEIYTVTNNKDDFIKIAKHHLLDKHRDYLWDVECALVYISNGSYASFSANVVNNKLTIHNYVDSSEKEAIGWIGNDDAIRGTPTEFLEALIEPGVDKL